MQKVLYQHVLPTLLEECKQCDSVIYALPTLLTVIDFATRDDYCDNILTEFCAILTLPKPVQVRNLFQFFFYVPQPFHRGKNTLWTVPFAMDCFFKQLKQ